MFFFFGMHPKVTVLTSSHIWNFTKNPQAPQKVFGWCSHEPSDKTEINHLASETYYQTFLKLKKKNPKLYEKPSVLPQVLSVWHSDYSLPFPRHNCTGTGSTNTKILQLKPTGKLNISTCHNKIFIGLMRFSVKFCRKWIRRTVKRS